MTAFLAFHDGIPVPEWQAWVLLSVYVGGFLAPAAWVARDARKRRIPPLPWTLLVLLASLLGVLQYRVHVRIVDRKARKGEDARELTEPTDL